MKSEVKGWKPLSVKPVLEVNRSEPKPPRQVTLNHRVGGSSPSRRTLLSRNTYFNLRGKPLELCASVRWGWPLQPFLTMVQLNFAIQYFLDFY